MAMIRACNCKHLKRPVIDSEDSIPPAYVAWRASTTNRVVVQARQAGNRFLGSLKGLQIRSLESQMILRYWKVVILTTSQIYPHINTIIVMYRIMHIIYITINNTCLDVHYV